jgi:hypothetical protein
MLVSRINAVPVLSTQLSDIKPDIKRKEEKLTFALKIANMCHISVYPPIFAYIKCDFFTHLQLNNIVACRPVAVR